MRHSIAGALALCASVALAAETTLYVPGFDPQPLTADIEGVDAQGRTTWRLGPGVTSGTYEDPAGIIHSATLVADATEAHLVYDDPEIGLFLSEDCGINNGVAVCTVVAKGDDPLVTATVTETASGFVVQGNAAATAPPAGSSTTPTAGSAVTSGPSATGGATPTGKDNGGSTAGVSGVVSLGVAGLVSVFLL